MVSAVYSFALALEGTLLVALGTLGLDPIFYDGQVDAQKINQSDRTLDDSQVTSATRTAVCRHKTLV